MSQQVPLPRTAVRRRLGLGLLLAATAGLLLGCASTSSGTALMPSVTRPTTSAALDPTTSDDTTSVVTPDVSTVISTAPPPPPVTATVTVTSTPASTSEPAVTTPATTRPTTTAPSTTAAQPTTTTKPAKPTTKPTKTTPPTTKPSTPSTPANGSDLTGPNTAYGSLSFSSPSGNIGCDISAESSVRCDIAKYTYQLPRDMEACDFGNRGNALMVEPGHNGYFPCVSDTVLTTSSPVLAYGSTATLGTITCASQKNGVTCKDESSDHGFRIAKASYELF